MHRGSQHYGIPFDSAYTRRGGYRNEDNMIEIVQQFREFKPYLKKRLAYIRQSGRDLELQDEVEDIEFYLEVMKDILADESHGVDQLRSFIDKIHEMIRKNPLTDLPISNRRSLDGQEEFGDNDRPRSPSPETRGSDNATSSIPLIPTHGAHRTVEVNFSARNDHPKPHKNEDTYDEWGRTFESSFSRREPYKDVDMRSSFYSNNSAMGRGERRWSGESDLCGARGMGRGMGRGAPIPSHHRKDIDIRAGRGRGFNDNDYERRNDYHYDRKERDRDYKPPDWLTGGGNGGGPSNGNKFDDWQPKSESRDNNFRTDIDRRSREDEWRTHHSESRDRDEKFHHAQHIANYFERRPSVESRRDERSEDYISMFDRQRRNERHHDPANLRHDMSSPHSDFNHVRSGPGGYHGRAPDHQQRSRMDSGPSYPPPASAPSLMNPMSSIPIAPQQAGYGVAQPPPRYNGPGLLGPAPFTNASPPLLPLPVPNTQSGLGMPNMTSGVAHPMGFQQQPPPSNYPMPDRHPNPSGYRIPPVPLPRPPVPPPQIRTVPSLQPPEHYQTVPSGSPKYTSPAEPSADQVREITMLKAKQCFGRVVSRSPSGISSQTTQGPSSLASSPPGPTSPSNCSNDNQSSCGLDPRLNRARPVSHPVVQNRQQSPPVSEKSPPPRAYAAPRPDAGNVLRPSSDPRARSRIEQDRKRFQETRDRFRSQDKSYNSKQKGSKMQELRKQLEKEGFHRLGRPAPKKQTGTFEDAITATPDEEPEVSGKKSGEKSRSSSSSSSHGKDREGDTCRQSRSQSEKTEREKSPKKKGGEKVKPKERTPVRSTSTEESEKDTEEITRGRSPRRKCTQNAKDKSKEKDAPQTSKAEAETSGIIKKTVDPTKPPAFRIPRKPKPKEPEPEVEPIKDDITSDSTEKDVCTSPPASPEPALSQVPDAENRTETVEESEQPTTSSKSTTEQTQSTSSTSSSDVNPNALEYLKQFLMTSADPEEREFFLANPDNLKHIFFKIKSEISAAKGHRNEESGNSQETTADIDQDKTQAADDEEETQERGRSREKKKNSKRRSSLEKLHDALKEMRFDTMLPLGPRRCTRGGQEETPPEPPESTEVSATEKTDKVDEVKTSSAAKEPGEEADKPSQTRKRGRPPKESPKKKSASKAPTTEGESEIETVETETAEVVVEIKTPIKRGQKRKLKPTKVNPRKRAKKAGPITRAQAALKNKKDAPKNDAEKTGVTTRNRTKAANNPILRRLTRNRVGEKDTVVNKGLCKIKLETDYTANVKSEPKELDPFLNSSNIIDDEADHLDDQLANIIDENLASLDNQAEDNMDFNLDVFNSLDNDDGVGEVCVKNEMELSLEEAAAQTELSFEGILGPIPTPSHVENNDKPASPPSPSSSTSDLSRRGISPVNLDDSDTSSSLLSLPGVIPEFRPEDTFTLKYTQEHSTFNRKIEPITPPLPIVEEAAVPTKRPSKGRKLSEKKEKFHPPEDESSCMSAASTISITTSSPVVPKPVVFKKEPNIKMESTDSGSDASTSADNRKEKEVSKCDKCSFSGKKIVAHYVNKHYPCNIPQARLMPETFNGLIELNTSESPQLLEIALDETQNPIWPCLYCDDRFQCIVEFYDHLTSHTGEFRYECTECGASYPFQKSLINHVKIHKGVAKNYVRFAFESVIEKNSRELSGFLCNDCFYFQLRFESIMRHIEQTGHSTFDVRSVRLIRPSAFLNEPITFTDTIEKKVDVKALAEKLGEKVSASEVPPVKLEPVKLEPQLPKIKADTRVFFGTNTTFIPPSVPTGECNLEIPKAFEDNFLEHLRKKVDGGLDGMESRKRKRNSSNASSSSEQGIDQKEQDSADHIKVKIRRTFNKPKTKIDWETGSDESLTEEPNNFIVTSDEDSSDSSVWSSEEESDDDFGSKEPNLDDDCFDSDDDHQDELKPGLQQNNEKLLKVRNIPKWIKWDEKYFQKHNLMVIRRSGDTFIPSVSLYGYIKTGIDSRSTPHKLRDQREMEKLCTLFGGRHFPVKCIPKYEEMITNEKLLHLFKCMSTVCSFTTDRPAEFLQHLNSSHFTCNRLMKQNDCARFLEVRDVVMMKDSDACSYCAARYLDARDLVEHIMNQHAQSPFQCNKCFYRSFYHRYVARHFEKNHPGEVMEVLKCPRRVNTPVEESTLFQIFVYKCNIENSNCDKTRRYVFREDFEEHLRKCSDGPNYPCHLCKSEHLLENLIEHYKTHNLFRYHCSYCTFGSEIKKDLDEHFVLVHPNTSGRVFYRVKPSPESKTTRSIFPLKKPQQPPKKKQKSNSGDDEDDNEEEEQNSNGSSDKEGGENHPGLDASGMDISENEDNEKGRITNLKGRELYRCVTGDCGFDTDNYEAFKEHVNGCTFVSESRSLSCAHCERKMKTSTNLLEHMKVHGEKKQTCSLCTFRCWTVAEVTKHIKTVHRISTHKIMKKEICNAEPDPDYVAYPKDVLTKSLCSVETFENNYYSCAKKAVYSFENIDKLPMNKVFSSDLNCALCPYATKVRSNIVRHLNIHQQAMSDGKTVVPAAQRINPVPYLSRETLEFDKMMNLAASSHKTDRGAATEAEVKKLPQFVKEQFRFVCSVCDHITSDDTLLQTHIRVIHSEVSNYKCPHCAKTQASKDNPDNTVPLDKIAFHLRLHGPKLYKCGHCNVVHHQSRLMEKHIPEKHPEKKPIHYLIRDLDPDGVPSARPTTSGLNRRQSIDDPKGNSTEKWKCFLCSSKSIFSSWSETKSHCQTVHKVNHQFMCLICGFAHDEVKDMLKHSREKCRDLEEETKRILVMFSKCEMFDPDDASLTAPVWKKNAGPVRHIHGNFTEDSVALIKQYNNQTGTETPPPGVSSPVRNTTTITLPTKNLLKPATTAASKARRSVGGSSSAKTSPIKTAVVPPATTPTKVEVFKYYCHKCDIYKAKSPQELRVHLYNEFRYKRWMCLVCSTKFTTEKSLKGHIERDHQKPYQSEFYELQPENIEIEGEIDECIEKQNRKKEMINSFVIERNGKLACKYCNDDEYYTYETFETHILLKHSS